MNRNIAREMAVQAVFSASLSNLPVDEFLKTFFCEDHFLSLQTVDELYEEMPKGKMMDYISRTSKGVFEHILEIDALIGNASKGWSVSRLSGTARAVLRVAVFEMLFAEDVPVGAAINSAIEIEKKYDDPEVVSFVNGVLGTISKKLASTN